MCVFICVCVCVCCMYISMYLCRSVYTYVYVCGTQKLKWVFFNCPLLYFTEVVLSVNLELLYLASVASLPSACIPCLPPECWDYRWITRTVWLSHGSGDLIWSLHACGTSIYLLNHLPSSSVSLFPLLIYFNYSDPPSLPSVF